MEVADVWRALRRTWWVAVLTTALLAGGMYAWSSTRTPLYQSSAQVFVTLAKSSSGSDLSQGATFIQAQVASYAQLVTSPIVLDPVAQRLGVSGGGSALKSQVSSSSSKETVIISIVATDPSAPRSAQITEALATELGVAVRSLAPRSAENEPTVQTVIISRSAVPTSPSAPKVGRDTAAAGVAGLLLGLVIAVGIGLLRARRNKNGRHGRPDPAPAPDPAQAQTAPLTDPTANPPTGVHGSPGERAWKGLDSARPATTGAQSGAQSGAHSGAHSGGPTGLDARSEQRPGTFTG